MKKSEVPFIGKRGLAGVIGFAWGVFSIVTAHSTANLLVNTPIGPDTAINAASMMYYDEQAKTLGYNTAEEYLTAKYRKEGAGGMLVGAAFITWGFLTYGRKKLAGENPQTPQAEKPAVPVVVSENKQTNEPLDKQAMAKGFQNEFLVSSPLVKTLLVWFCRIFGPLGCVGSIGMFINAIGGKATQDDMGAGGSVVMFLVFAGLTACGFWKRKKKAV